MIFTGEEYYRAGIERMRQAREIHDAGEGYALAIYTGGLAVECMLRAFRWNKDKSFEGRHDLEDLLKASDFLSINEERSLKRGVSQTEIEQISIVLRSAMNEVVALWHNNLRFAPEASLQAFLRRIGRVKRIRGSALKKNSADLINAAQLVVDRGVTLWISRRR
jgi:flavin-dependent dehydrogenase